MAWLDEQLTEQFYTWELRGRGWQVYDSPVAVEPPFRPFYGHFASSPEAIDDGRKPTAISSFFERFQEKLAPETKQADEEYPPEEEPEPTWFVRDSLQEVAVSLPSNLQTPREAFEQFLFNLSNCQEPVAFELLGTSEAITPLFVAHPSDAVLIRRQLGAHFPDAVLTPCENKLADAWTESAETAIVEFGLADEFMLPLAVGKIDGFIGIISALSELAQGETGLFQILFQPVRAPWGESMLRAVTDNEGDSFFINRPEMLPATKQKLSRPLFAAVIRLAAKSDDLDRAWEIVRGMAGALSAAIHKGGNELIPLKNDDYPLSDHEEDVLLRQSRRPGVILNSEELLAFVHLPSSAVATSKLTRQIELTKAAPKIAVAEQGVLLGQNNHGGKMTEVRLSPEQRTRHMHINGASGTGKSTLLFNLIREDIERGQGLAVLDPHGDLIERVLSIIPKERTGNVVLLDPSDEEFSVGFNILSAHSDLEKTLLSSDLVSIFERLSTSWGDQMSSVLRNAILAFLESEQGGTLADLRRFLIDPAFRTTFLESVSDPEVVYYWRKAFPQLTGNKSIGPVVTRLDTFLAPKPIRFMVSQRENKLDFSRIMDERKIFLAKLPQGEIGRENSYLLGSLIVAKFQQAAMSRQRLREEDRNFFSLYLDEFHHFITPSLAEMLSGARKYRVALVLAHQELRQLQRDAEVASATLSNPYTRVVFRVGDADARTLADGFASFEAKDLQSLGVGEAVCRIERSDHDFNISIPLPEEPDAVTAADTRNCVKEASRSRYGARSAEVEAKLRETLYTSPLAEKKETAPKAIIPSKPEPEPEKHLSEPKRPEEVREKQNQPENRTAEVNQKQEEIAKAPKSLGKGGQKHKDLQQFIKQWAQGMGYMAVIEEQIEGGQVDVSLQKNNRKIACEISVTTAIEHEIQNVRKCLASSFNFIALVVPEAKRIPSFEKAFQGSFSDEEMAKVRVITPEGLLAFIEEFDAKDADRNQTICGYKVKVKHHVVDQSTKEQRSAILSKVIAESRKRQKN